MSDGTGTRRRRDSANGSGPDGQVRDEARDRVERALRPPGIDFGAALRAAGSLAADLAEVLL